MKRGGKEVWHLSEGFLIGGKVSKAGGKDLETERGGIVKGKSNSTSW